MGWKRDVYCAVEASVVMCQLLSDGTTDRDCGNVSSYPVAAIVETSHPVQQKQVCMELLIRDYSAHLEHVKVVQQNVPTSSSRLRNLTELNAR